MSYGDSVIQCETVAWWLSGGGGRGELRNLVRIFSGALNSKVGALKSVIANVKYYTKYVKSGLSTN